MRQKISMRLKAGGFEGVSFGGWEGWFFFLNNLELWDVRLACDLAWDFVSYSIPRKYIPQVFA